MSARLGLVSARGRRARGRRARGRRARGRGARLDRGGAERGGALAHQPRHPRDALRHSLQVIRRGRRPRRRGRVNGLRRGGRRRGGVHRRGLLHARIRRLHWRRRRLRAVRGLARHLSPARSRLRGPAEDRTQEERASTILSAFSEKLNLTYRERLSRGRRGVAPPEPRRATQAGDREVASVRAWRRAAAFPGCFRLPGWFRAGLVCHGGRSDTRIGACSALSESVDDAGAEVSRRPACRPGLPETRRVRA